MVISEEELYIIINDDVERMVDYFDCGGLWVYLDYIMKYEAINILNSIIQNKEEEVKYFGGKEYLLRRAITSGIRSSVKVEFIKTVITMFDNSVYFESIVYLCTWYTSMTGTEEIVKFMIPFLQVDKLSRGITIYEDFFVPK
jgi:hypothetical protein